MWVFHFLHCLMLVIFCLLILAVLVGKKWYLARVLICTPLYCWWPFHGISGHLYIFFERGLFKPFARWWILPVCLFFTELYEFFLCSMYTFLIGEKYLRKTFWKNRYFLPQVSEFFWHILYTLTRSFPPVLWTLFVVLSEVQFLEKIFLF